MMIVQYKDEIRIYEDYIGLDINIPRRYDILLRDCLKK